MNKKPLLPLFFASISFALVSGGCMVFKPYAAPVRTETETEKTKLLSLLDQSINEFGLPGIQAGILKPGQGGILAASGTVDMERRLAPIDDHSSFRVGSTTKMFVAALILRMSENRLLSLDDSVDKWFPAYPQAATIRVRDLLRQTSGIKDSLFTDPAMMVISLLDSGKRWDPEKVMAALAKKSKPKDPSLRGFSYANDNYVLLGLIAEKTGKAKLATLLEREFLIPLSMDDTCLLPWSGRVSGGAVSGYDEFIPLGPHLIAADQTSWDSLTFGAGAMSSSAHDLLLWLDALFHGRVLSDESLAAMRSWGDAGNNGRDDAITGYGMGLARYEVAGKSLEGHPGGGFGGECFPFYDPLSDTSYVVVFNVSRMGNPAGKAILAGMLDMD